jgi:hypothetical protein
MEIHGNNDEKDGIGMPVGLLVVLEIGTAASDALLLTFPILVALFDNCGVVEDNDAVANPPPTPPNENAVMVGYVPLHSAALPAAAAVT